jgi:hypothetical protein
MTDNVATVRDGELDRVIRSLFDTGAVDDAFRHVLSLRAA